MNARLNVFQETQRLWDTSHPYNAAQAMQLAGDFSQAAVAEAFNAAVADLGLGEFVCDGTRYHIESAERVDVARPSDGFEAFLSGEMNRPFDAGRSYPFRPFDLVDGGGRYVGLTYQHWVADSVSIRLLMRQWLRRLTGAGGRCPVRLPAGGLLQTFGPGTADWSMMAQTASLMTLSSRMRKMRRVEPNPSGDVRVLLRAAPDGLADALRVKSRAVGATVGDVFLAAAAIACDEVGPAHATRRRPDLCLGTIVDLRARNAKRADNVFGLFLGFTMTAFAADDLTQFDRVLKRAAAARRSNLARHAAEASQLNLALGYGLARILGPKKLPEFYRKRFPLVGGLSSVNITPGWAGDANPTPLEAYHRVSPCGPMLPLVLTPTTLGRKLQICCTFKSGLIDGDAADALVRRFVGCLTTFASH